MSRRNDYPGTCYRCGGIVDAHDGHYERTSRKVHLAKWPQVTLPKWLLQHATCAVKYRGTAVHYLHAPDQDLPKSA